MALARRLWDSFTGVNLARRQVDSIPGMCYDDCNAAALLAQETGKMPSICDPDSEFQRDLDLCRSCIADSSESDNSTSGNSTTTPLPELLEQWINFCADKNTDAAKIQELLSSKAELDSSLQALTGSGTETGTALATPTTRSASVTTDASSPVTVTAVPSGSSSSSNVEVIAPAVVVPVVVVIMAVIAGIVFMRRRRQRRQKQTQGDDAHINSDHKDNFIGKPELHADPFRPELDGTKPAEKPGEDNGVIAELPAREAVGSELDAKPA